MRRYIVNIRVRETRALTIEAKSKTEAMLLALKHPDYKHTVFDREVSVGCIYDSNGNIV